MDLAVYICCCFCRVWCFFQGKWAQETEPSSVSWRLLKLCCCCQIVFRREWTVTAAFSLMHSRISQLNSAKLLFIFSFLLLKLNISLIREEDSAVICTAAWKQLSSVKFSYSNACVRIVMNYTFTCCYFFVSLFLPKIHDVTSILKFHTMNNANNEKMCSKCI